MPADRPHGALPRCVGGRFGGICLATQFPPCADDPDTSRTPPHNYRCRHQPTCSPVGNKDDTRPVTDASARHSADGDRAYDSLATRDQDCRYHCTADADADGLNGIQAHGGTTPMARSEYAAESALARRGTGPEHELDHAALVAPDVVTSPSDLRKREAQQAAINSWQ